MRPSTSRLLIRGVALILLLSALFMTKCAYDLFRSFQRVPQEIPVLELVASQLDALGPQWSFSNETGLNTDTDLTDGVWNVYVGFDHTDWRYNISGEIHVFSNADQAKLSVWPSPMAFAVDTEGNTPTAWNYEPAHADRFILDCDDGSLPNYCLILLRYQEYSFVYAMDVAGAMTLADLQRFIQATDEFMYDYLSSTTLEPGRREVPTLDELGLSK